MNTPEFRAALLALPWELWRQGTYYEGEGVPPANIIREREREAAAVEAMLESEVWPTGREHARAAYLAARRGP